MFDRMNHDAGTRFFRIFAIICFILFAACLHILPHPWNFTPVGAMALFGGFALAERLSRALRAGESRLPA